MSETKIKQIIKEWGISYQWVADKIGVSHASVSRWMNGNREMPENRRVELTNLLSKLPERA